jgi:phospholipid/cholesterol/gamma-HCH transport system substrate-binding protein
MPRTRSLAWSELKIGVLAVAALIIAATLIFALGGQGGFFWQRYSLKVRLPNAAGVKPGSPVRVAGVEVGSVTTMSFVGSEVETEFQLLKDMRDRVRTTSVATVGSVSLLGEGAIDITARTDGVPLSDWGYVRYAPTAATLSDVTTQASQGLEQVNLLVRDLRTGRGTAGRLLTDEGLYRQMTDLTNAASSVMRALQQGRGSLGRLLNDPTTARELETSLMNLTSLTQRLSAGQGSLGKLLKDEQFAQTLTATTRNFETLSERLNKGEGTAGKLLTDDAALYVRLNAVAERFEKVAVQLSEGEGSAGRLLNDRQLYDNMNQAAGELRALIADIRKDPRRYLSVRVSIF